MLNIAITGGGPVGLTLARLLLQSSTSTSVNITIYEKDASRTSRTSFGGTLDLHPETGLAAIKQMNVWDEFLKYARFEGEELRICDLNGTVYVHQTEAPQLKGFQARPEIDRVRLMQVLLESVPNELIRWGKALKEVVREDDQWKLKFDDGSVAGPFDLIVGADGAWSKVRKALTDVEPSYAGICGVAGSIDKESAGDTWDLISGMVGKGSNFCFSYGQSMMAQRLGDGNLKCSFYAQRERGWVDDLKANHTGDDDALKRILLENYQEWDNDFKQWIVAAKELWSAPLFELPVGQRFDHKGEITLIGDAAHLMTPFAGEGVNAGMRDALDLVGAIEKSVTEKTDLDLAVQAWEESMFERSAVFMADTMVNKLGMFAQDAPYSFFAAMIGVFARANGYDVKQGWMSWLPVTKTAYAFVWAIGTCGVVRRHVIDIFRGQQQRFPVWDKR
ncbi:hypothetical protein LTR70_006272 [Exophiala xenobiotica]|uniref:FAD-binding domain-containing protein n=1 Tax=Lithohypha guttulata TaxID=1690604 RepID=A0ABR0KHV3_9EURO|nr:hypothetical protein LTR24_002412 [Lithohypha guttulata]KAK5316318.1 hypothetical protein LTR70_006272 [Exophiala xenobiotica]